MLQTIHLEFPLYEKMKRTNKRLIDESKKLKNILNIEKNGKS
jgi:hypothetical protein